MKEKRGQATFSAATVSLIYYVKEERKYPFLQEKVACPLFFEKP
jgi:hypothetical protein